MNLATKFFKKVTILETFLEIAEIRNKNFGSIGQVIDELFVNKQKKTYKFVFLPIYVQKKRG